MEFVIYTYLTPLKILQKHYLPEHLLQYREGLRSAFAACFESLNQKDPDRLVKAGALAYNEKQIVFFYYYFRLLQIAHLCSK